MIIITVEIELILYDEDNKQDEGGIVLDIGHTIQHHRKEKNISIEQLALNTRLSISTIKKIENNEIVPDRDTLFKLSTALDIPISEYQL